MEEAQHDLLLEIVHCRNVLACLHDPTKAHPCNRIISSQRSKSIDTFQVPEPWTGRLPEAPLLFLSSNPSISETERYPANSWNEQAIAVYFDQRFKKEIADGIHARQQDGSHSAAVRFWSEVRTRAAELYERAVKPGEDYALTEVVHCKSRRNEGVKQALKECSDRYLWRVLACSSAKVIVCFGKLVREIVSAQFAIPCDVQIYGPAEIAGKIRHIVFSAQPGSNQPRRFSVILTKLELAKLKEAVSR